MRSRIRRVYAQPWFPGFGCVRRIISTGRGCCRATGRARRRWRKTVARPSGLRRAKPPSKAKSSMQRKKGKSRAGRTDTDATSDRPASPHGHVGKGDPGHRETCCGVAVANADIVQSRGTCSVPILPASTSSAGSGAAQDASRLGRCQEVGLFDSMSGGGETNRSSTRLHTTAPPRLSCSNQSAGLGWVKGRAAFAFRLRDRDGQARPDNALQSAPALEGSTSPYRRLAQNRWMRSQACCSDDVAVA